MALTNICKFLILHPRQKSARFRDQNTLFQQPARVFTDTAPLWYGLFAIG